MDLGITGKVALVTGGSLGIGRATAISLAREGVKVAICARRREHLDATQREIQTQGGQCLSIEGDMCKVQDLNRVIETTHQNLGNIDILVNNVGGGTETHKIQEIPDEAWTKILELNLLTMSRTCQLVVPGMRERQWGRIVNISSVAGKIPDGTNVLYSAIKAAVINYSKSLSEALARYNILVNTICPGLIHTPLWDEYARILSNIMKMTPEKVMETVGTRYATLKRYGKPEEVADLVIFISSERASYITGATFNVDGGFVKYASG